MTSPESQASLLSVQGIDVYYGETKVLHDLSLKVENAELVALLGSNGAGKTTTLRTLSGLLRPAKGEIKFDSHSISELSANRIAGLGISMVPEGRGLFTTMTVRENLEMGAFAKRARREMKKTLDEVYSLFPILKDRQNQLAGSLSGGEQQMLAIGRALMSKPKLIMLDEPSLGLAPIVISKVFDALKALKENKMTIVLVEQNIDGALRIADRGYLLENGRLALEGNPTEIRNNEMVRQFYLGL
ncbi:MAG: ABC transporter ATP-binding protein [Nitrososphaerota archaeon]|nr:ABC transporter ATP-binding protein [Nitrososphaerota archaeon]